MTNSNERYVHDYQSAHATQIVQGRSAEVHAAFFLPHLRPDMTVLDVGCGPGTITAGFARIVQPGKVHGLDQEQSQLDIGISNAQKQGLSNLEFLAGTVYQLPFEDESFDAVFAHAVIEHLSDKQGAFAELFRVLKPGGVVGLRSADWRGFIFAPRTDELEQIWQLQYRIREHNGGDPFIGSKFRSILREAGFENTRASATFEYWGDSEGMRGLADVLVSMFTDPAASEAAIENGWVDEEGMLRIEDAIRDYCNHPDSFFAHPWIEAVANKPA